MSKRPDPVPNHALRRAREQRGWSRDHLADRLETNAFTIYRWEAGRSFPRPHFRQQLAEIFGLDLAALDLTPKAIAEAEPPTDADAPDRHIMADQLARHIFLPPPPEGGLVGRDALLATLQHRLSSDPSSRLIALHGLPGVGKTALAATLAHDTLAQDRFPDGVLWAELGPRADVAALLGRWARSAGYSATEIARWQDATALRAAMQTAIGDRRLLLIIDDVWALEDAIALKAGGQHCAHIITTRFLDIAAQWEPQRLVHVGELTADDGLRLLRRLAPAAVDLEPRQTREIVAAVGALPLALALIGHELQVAAASGQPRRIAATLQRLRDRRTRLQVSMAAPDTSASLPTGMALSLRGAIAPSVERLTAEAQSLLALLALFPAKPRSFTEEAALAASSLPQERFFAALDALLDSGLVEGASPGRYRLHPTIADVARDLPRDEAAERMAYAASRTQAPSGSRRADFG